MGFNIQDPTTVKDPCPVGLARNIDRSSHTPACSLWLGESGQ